MYLNIDYFAENLLKNARLSMPKIDNALLILVK